MAETTALRALGLMSGTSMDGIDAALITTDGERVSAFGPTATVPYDAAFRERLRAQLGREPDAAAIDVGRELTDRHAEAVRGLIARAGRGTDVAVVGFPGHTVLHRPESGITRQIGDGLRLAESVGIDVVEDFRSADVAAGGQGAPFAPLYHAALAADLVRPLAVLNVGGVANVTWIGADGTVIAFDTGPGNALIDDWMRSRGGRERDDDGKFAFSGRIDEDAVVALLGHDHFRRPPPKSLDRDAFAGALTQIARMGLADGAATLAAFTAQSVAAALAWMPERPRRWLVTGGGRHNHALMAMLIDAVGAPAAPVESVGWDGDALEAQAFAFLAVRSLRGLPLSLPTTTGVPAPQTGGVLRRA